LRARRLLQGIAGLFSVMGNAAIEKFGLRGAVHEWLRGAVHELIRGSLVHFMVVEALVDTL